ncbi:MAG: D-alanyl-D-alanine carboxypeptidase [uncultured Solirubrobacteraceae bacterium]|uniref:D-alanyl-D-alanine carboxypeptidase n=1 Tax=uncultured Solirubrobacteraceae bacterium TaxID=1162706 RepID=A0A6J4RP26_9ACTN|nr:MAG: D-alanyl-D-alanine carboxypeptidase [uncultured Solirubrobacteraceae bacterium]
MAPPVVAAVLLLAVVLAAALVPARAVAALPPEVDARNAIVVETSTGEVVYARRPDRPRPIASATKLMTALLVLERLPRDRSVPASGYRPAPVESQIGLRPGERLTVADLTRGLLLASANDAAVTLAEATSGSRPAFVRAMNARARKLGLTRTRFDNPIGLDAPDNRSTARDLVRLTLQLRTHPFFRRTVALEQATLRSGDRTRFIRNRNTLVAHRRVDGVKTGHTALAEYVLVASGRSASGVRLISVVLGEPDEASRNEDTLELLTWGFKQFRVLRPVRYGQSFPDARPPIRYRRGAELPLVAGGGVRRVVRRGDPAPQVEVSGVPERVEGPIRRGEQVGAAIVRVRQGSRVLAEVPLVAAAAVPRADFEQRAKDLVTRPYVPVTLLAAATASVLAVRALRRGRHRPGRRQGTARSA